MRMKFQSINLMLLVRSLFILIPILTWIGNSNSQIPSNEHQQQYIKSSPVKSEESSSPLVTGEEQYPQQITTPTNQLDQQNNNNMMMMNYIPRKMKSCFVCSTMEYDDQENNLCRSIKPSVRMTAATNYGGTMHQSRLSNINSNLQYIPPTASQNPNGVNDQQAVVVNSRDNESSTPITNDPSNGQYGDHGSSLSYLHESYTSYNHDIVRNASLMEPIRTRYCHDDEHFCSVVSIVRIEFINDKLNTKFWALERNCSKSCNSGCMLIGERVRLRVCSQCCRRSNCNFGSSSRSIHDDTSKRITIGFSIMLLSFMISFMLMNGKVTIGR